MEELISVSLQGRDAGHAIASCAFNARWSTYGPMLGQEMVTFSHDALKSLPIATIDATFYRVKAREVNQRPPRGTCASGETGRTHNKQQTSPALWFLCVPSSAASARPHRAVVLELRDDRADAGVVEAHAVAVPVGVERAGQREVLRGVEDVLHHVAHEHVRQRRRRLGGGGGSGGGQREAAAEEEKERKRGRGRREEGGHGGGGERRGQQSRRLRACVCVRVCVRKNVCVCVCVSCGEVRIREGDKELEAGNCSFRGCGVNCVVYVSACEQVVCVLCARVQDLTRPSHRLLVETQSAEVIIEVTLSHQTAFSLALSSSTGPPPLAQARTIQQQTHA